MARRPEVLEEDKKRKMNRESPREAIKIFEFIQSACKTPPLNTDVVSHEPMFTRIDENADKVPRNRPQARFRHRLAVPVGVSSLRGRHAVSPYLHSPLGAK